MHALSFLWDPSQGLDLGFFTLRYYSLMFVVAFVTGYILTKKIYKREGISMEKLDSLFIYVVIATLIGARLGHVIFYQSELFKEDFLSVFLPIKTVPEFEFTGFQGLASHGATIGIAIAMYYYSKKIMKKPLLWVLDKIVVGIAVGAIFVRIGNFINSEIIGKATGTDYGVVFKKLGESFPRHPAQLYEAAGYVLVLIILWFVYWKTEKRKKQGYLFGLFFVLLWTIRFFVEYVKESQGGFESQLGESLSTGQWLSIPFILIGLYFMFRPSKTITE